jgi:hypothetical protein
MKPLEHVADHERDAELDGAVYAVTHRGYVHSILAAGTCRSGSLLQYRELAGLAAYGPAVRYRQSALGYHIYHD